MAYLQQLSLSDWSGTTLCVRDAVALEQRCSLHCYTAHTRCGGLIAWSSQQHSVNYYSTGVFTIYGQLDMVFV